jgi:hypothetical protein
MTAIPSMSWLSRFRSHPAREVGGWAPLHPVREVGGWAPLHPVHGRCESLDLMVVRTSWMRVWCMCVTPARAVRVFAHVVLQIPRAGAVILFVDALSRICRNDARAHAGQHRRQVAHTLLTQALFALVSGLFLVSWTSACLSRSSVTRSSPRMNNSPK